MQREGQAVNNEKCFDSANLTSFSFLGHSAYFQEKQLGQKGA